MGLSNGCWSCDSAVNRPRVILLTLTHRMFPSILDLVTQCRVQNLQSTSLSLKLLVCDVVWNNLTDFQFFSQEKSSDIDRWVKNPQTGSAHGLVCSVDKVLSYSRGMSMKSQRILNTLDSKELRAWCPSRTERSLRTDINQRGTTEKRYNSSGELDLFKLLGSFLVLIIENVF